MIEGAPLPGVTEDSEPFWEASRAGRLLVRRCRACGRAHFYPRPFCPTCWSDQVDWEEASGRATLYTWSVVHQNDLPPFKDRVPYVVAIVELDEGVRLTSNVEGVDPEEVRCDMAVQVAFREEQRDEETVALAVFRPE